MGRYFLLYLCVPLLPPHPGAELLYKDTRKTIEEVDEDFSSYVGQDDKANAKEILQKIEAVMDKAKTSDGKVRFADFEGASGNSNLAKLKNYNEIKQEEMLEKAEKARDDALKDHNKQSSKDVVNKAFQEYKSGDLSYDEYVAILDSVKNTSEKMNESTIKENATDSFIEYLEDRDMLEDYLKDHETVAKENALKGDVESSSKEIINRAYQEYKNGNLSFNKYMVALTAAKELPLVDEPNKFYEEIIEGTMDRVSEDTISGGISKSLEAGGEQTKKIVETIRYNAATWGPNTQNSFVMTSKEASEKSSKWIKGANIAKYARFGVPVVGGVVDFFSMKGDGEDADDAAIKASAHVGIGMAGAAVGGALGSIVPGVGNIAGAAIGFVIGVGLTSLGNAAFDAIYDNREEIYDTVKDFGNDLVDGAKEAVGNAVSGFVSGLGTVFG